jgi:uncharacterized protein YukE
MYNNTVKIHGLTVEQVEMLDCMWHLDSYEEYQEWVETLDQRKKEMADLLKTVLLMEIAEMDENKSYTEATNLLKKFML